MARKGQSTPTPPAPAGGRRYNLRSSNVRPTALDAKPNEEAGTPQASHSRAESSAGAASGLTKANPNPLATSKTKKKTKAPKQPAQNSKESSASKQDSESDGSSISALVLPSKRPSQKQVNIASLAAVYESCVITEPNNQGSSCQSLEALGGTPAIEASSSVLDGETLRLAAATPVAISPAVERHFYESQLLLYVLEKVRGDHSKRQNYHGELDQDAIELRRSFVDKLAYICDFKKGGSTVTALALQKTYQGVTF